jgi:hypothetical protein
MKGGFKKMNEEVKTNLAQALSNAFNKITMSTGLLSNRIKGIYPNEKKKLVVVKWIDNSITKVNCSEKDTFDIYIGVALAYCKKFFGSNSQFRKVVDNLTKGAVQK